MIIRPFASCVQGLTRTTKEIIVLTLWARTISSVLFSTIRIEWCGEVGFVFVSGSTCLGLGTYCTRVVFIWWCVLAMKNIFVTRESVTARFTFVRFGFRMTGKTKNRQHRNGLTTLKILSSSPLQKAFVRGGEAKHKTIALGCKMGHSHLGLFFNFQNLTEMTDRSRTVLSTQKSKAQDNSRNVKAFWI